ncbi:Molybdopterin synthase sulfur carrier subunit [Penicillium herquei]|nr:Molybdopterin synthase sulfur carrier subunit [Penicillium herquei]
MASSNQLSDSQTQTGTFTIHYFATASQYTTKNTESLPAPLQLSLLFPLLEERYPGIREKVLASCGISLEGEYVDIEEDATTVIQAGNEVAIIPPVSSG